MLAMIKGRRWFTPPKGAATNGKTGKLFITTTLILLLMPRNQQPTHQRLVEAVTDADILRDMVKDGVMLLNWRKKQLGMLL
ncbi:hypothetical protein A0V01_05375 (plasmid) [Borrelia hermsii]|uniref:Variable large protein n=1 Tax=Borrelia hermsii TaxID=140 RepID=A0AAN0X6K7_BORHE|nr:hypothetical protein A0V01_05375 [Borrelia hermsii]